MVARDVADQPLEGQPLHEGPGFLLVPADLSQGHGAWLVSKHPLGSLIFLATWSQRMRRCLLFPSFATLGPAFGGGGFLPALGSRFAALGSPASCFLGCFVLGPGHCSLFYKKLNRAFF